MKKMIGCLLLASFFAACGSDSTTKSETDAKSAPVTPGIDNVNGNIPDTTEALRLNKPLPKDSSRANDSVQH